METIPIRVSNYYRQIWLSKEAKARWEKVFTELSKDIFRLEIESVAEGLRHVSWQTVDEKEYLKLAREWAGRGLISLPVRYSRKHEGFAHYHEDPTANEPKNVSVVVARRIESAFEFINAYERGDHVKQGELLGYPKCCCEAFQERWRKGYFDPIWQAAEETSAERIIKKDEREIILIPHIFSNPILRYAGIRLSFHIPCSFACEASIKLGSKYFDLLKSISSHSSLFEALLRMPVSWDCFHGIAVIRTPIFYLIIGSMPTKKGYIVKCEGDFIPREGARDVYNETRI